MRDGARDSGQSIGRLIEPMFPGRSLTCMQLMAPVALNDGEARTCGATYGRNHLAAIGDNGLVSSAIGLQSLWVREHKSPLNVPMDRPVVVTRHETSLASHLSTDREPSRARRVTSHVPYAWLGELQSQDYCLPRAACAAPVDEVVSSHSSPYQKGQRLNCRAEEPLLTRPRFGHAP